MGNSTIKYLKFTQFILAQQARAFVVSIYLRKKRSSPRMAENEDYENINSHSWLHIYMHELRAIAHRIARRLREEPAGRIRCHAFFNVCLAITREIWAGPVTGVEDPSIVRQLMTEIEDVAIIMDNILEPSLCVQAYLTTMHIVLIYSVSSPEMLLVLPI